MGVHQKVEQFVVVDQDAINPHQTVHELALFNADGTARTVATQAAAQADSTADTIPEIVADFNALLAKLRAAGVMAT